MVNIKNIHISDFDYELPDDRIPRHPIPRRDACKLLFRDSDASVSHHIFSELPDLLPSGSLLVCNDTKVINARISFYKSTGSRIEVFLLEPVFPEDYVLMFQAKGCCRWKCLVGNLKRWKSGELEVGLDIQGRKVNLTASRIGSMEDNSQEIEFRWDAGELDFASILEVAGNIPIPPYLKRDSEKSDLEDYQTVYAHAKGSVAAPTAGLHFTDSLMADIRVKGIDVAPLTLHVGAGTFKPVKSETIGEHPMHTEIFSIGKDLLRKILDTKSKAGTVVAVGTTSVRTLESLAYLGRALKEGRELNVTQWEAYKTPINKADALGYIEFIYEYMESKGYGELTASTSIMIAPGYCWNIVGGMVTNFHQPQSTLLLLVSSFLNRDGEGSNDSWRLVYNEALKGGYRFLSYGDACLFM